ncbi:MAG TPA: HPF/RaiA family ribosome-associated protein [Usitatibacter sp.]|nr:HPF/RaiA family ribosome-associated protein [Usitatibacter sp.]
MRRSGRRERLTPGRCHTGMQEPQITYRGMPHSPAMDARILELAAKLEDLHPKITSCRVVVNEADKRKSKGNQFEVRVDVHVPGREIVATNQKHEDAYAAITSAFEVLTRQLEEGLEIQRGEVKRHRDERGDNSLP